MQAWSELLQKIIADVWEKYGPFAALLFILLALHLYMFHRMYNARLTDKDAEIKRLTADRDRFRDVVLTQIAGNTQTGTLPFDESQEEQG